MTEMRSPKKPTSVPVTNQTPRTTENTIPIPMMSPQGTTTPGGCGVTTGGGPRTERLRVASFFESVAVDAAENLTVTSPAAGSGGTTTRTLTTVSAPGSR